MDCLYIVIPAYNEEANIEEVINDWYPVVERNDLSEKSRLLIMDDGSSDHTFQILEQAAALRPRLLVVHRENGGHGATIYDGYQYAILAGADYIFQTDSDRQTLPEEFGKFWEKREEADILIGNRIHRQDGPARVFTAKVLKFVLFSLFHVSVRDANTPYRLMKADILKEELSFVPKQYFLCNVLLSALYAKHERRCFYLPITFRERQGGKNSIDMKKIFGIGRRAVKEFYQISKKIQVNPAEMTVKQNDNNDRNNSDTK